MKLPKSYKQGLAGALIWCAMVLLILPHAAAQVVNIPDANLRTVIAEHLGKAEGAQITREEMATLHPFNPETWIPYQLAEPAEVSVSIYAGNGKLVRRLDLGYQPAGVYHIRSRAAYWDGMNSRGERVASGVYFYTFTAGDFTATRKMLIVK